jgi:hypothetical protein
VFSLLLIAAWRSAHAQHRHPPRAKTEEPGLQADETAEPTGPGEVTCVYAADRRAENPR